MKSRNIRIRRLLLCLSLILVALPSFLAAQNRRAVKFAPQSVFTVTTTSDDNGVCDSSCSLREAINAANGSAGPHTIAFNLPGSAPFVIAPTSPLPQILSETTIDGSTQPGFSSAPIVELSGAAAGGSGHGLEIVTGGVIVQSLVINGFSGAGIRFFFAAGGAVRNCYIGTGANGLSAVPNQTGIFVESSNGVLIGGPNALEGNVISGNSDDGIRFFAVGFNSNNNFRGNRIGVGADNATPLPNGGDGIELEAGFDGSTNLTRIGDTAVGAGNTIAFNGGRGINMIGARGVRIRGNSIYQNGQLGIDLESDQVTPNDSCDADTIGGFTGLQNFPVITGVTSNATTSISGTFNSAPNQTFSLDFFSGTESDPTGFGEGRAFLGSVNVTTNAACEATFSAEFPVVLSTGDPISATATDSFGNTSEFSAVSIFGALPTDLSVDIADSADPVNPGDAFNYVITVTNDAAGATAFNAALTDFVPPEFPVSSVATTLGTCSNAGQIVSCSFGNMPPGATATVTIAVGTPVAGTFTNTANISLSNPDPDLSDNSAAETTQVNGAELTVLLTDSADPVVAGDELTFTIAVTNSGTLDAQNTIAFFPFEPSLVFVSASLGCTNLVGSVQCNFGTLGVGATATATVTVRTTVAVSLNNGVSVQTSTPETDTGNNQDGEFTLVQGADIALTVAAPATAKVGAVHTYEFTVANNGPALAGFVRIATTLPFDVYAVGGGAVPDRNRQTVLSFGTIPAGQSRTVVVQTIPRSTGNFNFTAMATTSTGDLLTGDNIVTTPTSVTAFGSAADYSFSTSTDGSFIPTAGGRLIYNGVASTILFSSPSFEIGFDFHFMGRRFSRFTVSPSGYIQLDDPSATSSQPLGVTSAAVIAPFASGQTLTANSFVRTIVSGSAPNRVRVVTWSGMSSSIGGTTADLTYQLQISEATGEIKFVYGTMQMNATGAASTASNRAQIGFSVANAAGKIGSVTAPQNSASLSFDAAAAAATVNVNNVAGPIQSLNSPTSGAQRVITLTPAAAPDAPSALTATNVGHDSMRLQWTDGSANEDGFLIYRSTDGTNFEPIAEADRDTTSFAALKLVPNTPYFWRMAAIRGGRTSGFATVSATTASTSTVTATASGNWSDAAIWSGGIVPGAANNVVVPAGLTVTVDEDAFAADLNVAGTLLYESVTARNLEALNVTVDVTGTLAVPSAGSQFAHELRVAGNVVNNGTLDLHADPVCCNRPSALLALSGDRNASLTGSGLITDLSTLRIFKPNLAYTDRARHIFEIAPTNFTVRGTNSGDINGFIDLRAGTLKLSGSFPLSSVLLTNAHRTGSGSSSTLTLDTFQGLWLNNPNFVWASSNSFHTILRFRISQIGSGTVLSKPRFGDFTMENGTIGFIKAIVSNLTQTGGELQFFGGSSSDCTGPGLSNCVAALDIPNDGSSMNISGGQMTFVLPQSDGLTVGVDYSNRAAQNSFTGGLVQFGNASSGAAKTFTLCGEAPEITISNQSAGHTVFAVCNTVIRGNVTVNPATRFRAGGGTTSVSLRGASFINNGTLEVFANSNGTAPFSFDGNVPQTYSGAGVAGTSGAPLQNFAVANTGGGLTISPASPTIITNRVNLFTGTIFNSNKIQIGVGRTTTAIIQRGNASAQTTPSGAFDVAPTFNLGTGGLSLFYGLAGASLTTGNEIPATRSVRFLTVDASNSIVVGGGDLTIEGTGSSLNLTNGIIETGSNTLFVRSNATVARTNGFVSGNLRMEFAAIGSKTFHVGSADGYSPFTANVTALGANPSSLTVSAFAGPHPSAPSPSSALRRFWRLTETGDLTATLTFTYRDADLPAVPENSLELRRYTGSGAIFDLVPATVNAAANTVTTTGGISQFSDWTLFSPFAPTAANVSVSGRVRTAEGRGISNAVVSIANTRTGETRTVRTGSFGFYSIEELPTGETYILTVNSKRFVFANPLRVIALNDNATDEDFIADSNNR